LQPLPDEIKHSLRSYEGFLAGAVLRDAYIAAVKSAGFADAAIVAENQFPMDHMSCDSTANAIMGNIGLRANNVRAVTDTVVSIKVFSSKLP